MNDAVDLEIEFPCVDGGSASGRVRVIHLEANLYQLEETPFTILVDGMVFSVADASWKDVVEVSQTSRGALLVERVVQKSNYNRFSWVLSKSVMESEALEQLLQRVVEEDGHWEIVFGGVVIIYLAFNSPFDVTAAIENIRV